ncbi:MAG: hypothetical protein M1495_24860 [Bacteroidetes bacterium]|nr:hypothetical protein [Bacteroidota bacterium]
MIVQLKKTISRIIEELLPLPFYRKSQKEIILLVNKTEELKKTETFNSYLEFEQGELFKRITEEHARANLLDEKTSKLTLSISFGFTIIGILSSIFTVKINGALQLSVFVLSSLTILYALFCSMLSISSLKTLPFYGYGSEFLIQSKKAKSYVILALMCQEKINMIRQLRNETAYMCIRNSFICFFIMIIIYFLNILIFLLSPTVRIIV